MTSEKTEQSSNDVKGPVETAENEAKLNKVAGFVSFVYSLLSLGFFGWMLF